MFPSIKLETLQPGYNNAIAPRRLTIPSPPGNIVESNYAASVSLREMGINSFGAGERDMEIGEERLAIRVDAAATTREQADVVRRWDQGTDIGQAEASRQKQAGRSGLAINQRRPAIIYCSVSLFSRNKAHCSQNDRNGEVSQGFETLRPNR